MFFFLEKKEKQGLIAKTKTFCHGICANWWVCDGRAAPTKKVQMQKQSSRMKCVRRHQHEQNMSVHQNAEGGCDRDRSGI